MKISSGRDKSWHRRRIEPSRPPAIQPDITLLKERYDYVIVGGGSAGCVLANRLSEDPGVDVLLIEAGGEDSDPRIHVPREFEELQGTDNDWKYKVGVEQEPVLKPNPQRPFVPWPKGKVLGGSSAINALLYVRGNRHDYDHWAELGNEGWDYKSVLKYFIASEHNLSPRVSDEYHGRKGPLVVNDIQPPNPATDAFVKAASSIYDRCEDFNDLEQVGGAGYYQVTIDKKGKRSSTATTYLTADVRKRPNLTIATHALTTTLLFGGEQVQGNLKAVGVEFVAQATGRKQSVRAAREVLICAGTVESPKLLLLSGIGAAADLGALQIELVHDLPGVGQNLQDHPIAPVLYLYKPGKESAPSASGGVEAGLFLSTRGEADWPDLQFHFTHKILGQPGSPQANGGYMVVATLVRPKSRGFIKLKSADPNEPPEIRPNYLKDPADLLTLVEGLKIGRRIGEQGVFDKFRQLEAAPGPDADSDEKLAGFISMAAIGLYHPAGSCKMGPPSDALAVVDSRLRVHGIKGLRVVDASIMPTITAGNTNAPTIMIAEKAAAMIKEDSEYKPSRGRVIHIENTAQAFLMLLGDLGVKQVFGVPGSDVPALLDAFSKFAGGRSDNQPTPQPIPVPHEMCAMSMAHAYYLATGEPPVVLVHSTVGTGNAVCGLINASRANIPLILVSGRTPVTEIGSPSSRDLVIQWAQESFDQGGMVREFVKWDYELRTFDQLESVVRRAFAIAMTEPRGPVYLTLPRELLAEKHDQFTIVGTGREDDRRYTPVAKSAPDAVAIEEVAGLIAAAAQPLIITRSFGRRPENVSDLVQLAEAGAIPVIEYQIPEFMNFPSDHPLHLGFQYDHPPDPFAGVGDALTSRVLADADCILVIDCPMPWAPRLQSIREDACVIHIGVDPLHSRYPTWNFPARLALAADSATTVRQLTAALKKYESGSVAERSGRLGKMHKSQRDAWAQAAAKQEGQSKPNFVWVSHCLKQLIKDDENVVVLQEYDLQLPFAGFNRPGSYIGFSPSGGLGFALGGALGLKLGLKDKTIISLVGDGTYLLGGPSSAHLASAMHDLPVLWIVCNNRGWNYLALETMLVNGTPPGNFPMLSFPKPAYAGSGPWPNYEKLVEAFGGRGTAVSQPRALPEALRDGLQCVRESKRQFLINIECEPFPLRIEK